jgi:ABC-type transport system substrate-binding protein
MTFTLRKGMKFTDGTDVDAAAVKWNMDMIKQGGLYRSTTDYWKSLDVIDTYTLKVTFTLWHNTNVRAWENYYVVSPTAYQKNGNDWMKFHMVGSGPFMQTDYQQDVLTAYKANPNFWNQGHPYLDAVQMLYVADPLTQEALIKSGGAEALTSSAKVSTHFANDPAFKILSKDQGPMALVPDSLNADSPYSKLQVRQALEYAVDRVGLAKAFGYGLASPAYQMGSPKSLAYVPTLAQTPYDPAKAKQLLAAAGYPNGFKTTIYADPRYDRDPVIAIQAQLAAIGITADVQFPLLSKYNTLVISPVSPSNVLFYTEILEMANYNTYMNVYWADPGTFNFLSTKKPDGWKDLFASSVNAPAPDKTILQQVGTAFYNDSTIVPLFYGNVVYIVSSKVQNSGLFSWGWDALWSRQDVWLSK